MQMVLDNFDEGLCHYLSVQEISLSPTKMNIKSISILNLATKIKENLLKLSADVKLGIQVCQFGYTLDKAQNRPELTTEAFHLPPRTYAS